MAESTVDQLTQAFTAALAAQRHAGDTSARIPRGFTPDPPVTFSGSDRSKLRIFKLEVHQRLTFFPDVPDSTKAAMVGNRLTGLAKEAFLRLTERTPAPDLTVDSVLGTLEQSFSDPNALQRALTQWAALKQLRSQPVLLYAARMRELLAIPGMDSFAKDDRLQQHQFRAGLLPELQRPLLVQTFDTVDMLIAAADRVEQALATAPASAQAAQRSERAGPPQQRGQFRGSQGQTRGADPPPDRRSGQPQPRFGGRRPEPPRQDPRGPGQDRQPRHTVPGTDGRTHPDRRCNSYGQFGHSAGYCPSQRSHGRPQGPPNRQARWRLRLRLPGVTALPQPQHAAHLLLWAWRQCLLTSLRNPPQFLSLSLRL